MYGSAITRGIAVAVTLAFMPRPAPRPEAVDLTAVREAAQLTRTERGVATLAAEMRATEVWYLRDVYPIEAALLSTKRVRDPMQARWAALALVLEAGPRDLSPLLLAKIMRVENPWLIADTTSWAGAVGWMQVMPMHEREGHPCGADLTDGRVNVCYGAEIWRAKLGKALGDAISQALLWYGGFVRAPGGEQYVARVLGTEGGHE